MLWCLSLRVLCSWFVSHLLHLVVHRINCQFFFVIQSIKYIFDINLKYFCLIKSHQTKVLSNVMTIYLHRWYWKFSQNKFLSSSMSNIHLDEGRTHNNKIVNLSCLYSLNILANLSTLWNSIDESRSMFLHFFEHNNTTHQMYNWYKQIFLDSISVAFQWLFL